MNIIVLRAVMLCAFALAGGAASGQAKPPVNSAAEESAQVGAGAAAGVSWQQLSIEQRELLAGMHEQWGQLPPGRQRALANGAKRFLRMDARQRMQANRRFEQWNEMSAAERSAITARFAEFRALTPREKARIRRASRRFDTLPPEQRRELRRQFQELTPEERLRAREQLRTRPRAERPKK
jgi:hypothetical protein